MSAVETQLSRNFWNSFLSTSDLRRCPNDVINVVSSYLTDQDLLVAAQDSTLNQQAAFTICQIAFGQWKARKKAGPLLLNCRKIIQLLKTEYSIEPFRGQNSLWERIKMKSGVENSIVDSYIKQATALHDLWQSLHKFQPNLRQLYRFQSVLVFDNLAKAQKVLDRNHKKILRNCGVICKIVSFCFGWLFRLIYNPYFLPDRTWDFPSSYIPVGKFSLPALKADEKSAYSSGPYQVSANTGPNGAVRLIFFNRDPNEIICWCTINPMHVSEKPTLYALCQANFQGPSKRLELIIEKMMQVLVEILLQNGSYDEMVCSGTYSPFLHIAGGFKGEGEDIDSLREKIVDWRAFAKEMASLSDEDRKKVEEGGLRVEKIENLAKKIMGKMKSDNAREAEGKGKEEQIDMPRAIKKLWHEVRLSSYPNKGDLSVPSKRIYRRGQVTEAEVYFSERIEPTSFLELDSIIKPGEGVLPPEIFGT